MPTALTYRETVPAIDDMIGEKLPVLDHGFVRLIDYMGSDRAIVDAARVSYGAGTTHVSDDRTLIRYLVSHRHTSPLEMCEIKAHVKLPVFVARQWIRHRTANVNEYSARYSILASEFYIPSPEQVCSQSTTNKQGRGEMLSPAEASRFIRDTIADANDAYARYEDHLAEGVSRELARINLPLNIYTEWFWKIDLRNLFHFLSLRADPHAQYEIRAYADVILDRLVMPWVPLAAEAFVDYQLKAATFSRQQIAMLQDIVSGRLVGSIADYGMTKREQGELIDALWPGVVEKPAWAAEGR